ncbi:MAG TPA: alpha/beta hydrolase [Caulobacteraceae bacterium]
MASFTASDGVEIAYDDLGPSGSRAALLVHGFASNRVENWKRTGWYAAFERRGQRLIAPDMRGHGESGKPHEAERYGRARIARDLAELIEHLGLGPVDLIGFSMGSGAALALALEQPDLVATLTLGGVGGRMLEPSRAPGAVAFAMEAENPDDIGVPLLRSFRQFADEQGEDRLALAACTKAPSQPVDPDSLFALRMPVLVVAGSRDDLAGDPQALADLIPGAHAVTLPACDHFSAIPHALLKAAVFDFLDGMLDEYP